MSISELPSQAEDRWISFINTFWVRHRNYVPKIHAYISYGSNRHVHILGRVILGSKNPPSSKLRRGLRTFFTAQVPNIKVKVTFADTGNEYILVTDRGGYFDKTIDVDLESKWHDLTFEFVEDYLPQPNHIDAPKVKLSSFNEQVAGKLLCISDNEKSYGIISDIDDTILVSHVTHAPLAMFMILLSNPHKRRAVKGMREVFYYLQELYPDIFTFFISAAPWNIFLSIRRFILSNGYPLGPLLLRDLGPSQNKLVVTTKEHKIETINNLIRDFPHTKWIMIGDDGQLDPQIYWDFAKKFENNIEMIIIRQMGDTKNLAQKSSEKLKQMSEDIKNIKVVYGHDGFDIIDKLKASNQ